MDSPLTTILRDLEGYEVTEVSITRHRMMEPGWWSVKGTAYRHGERFVIWGQVAPDQSIEVNVTAALEDPFQGLPS